MHATLTRPRRTSDATAKTGGTKAPPPKRPFVPASFDPKKGCVIYTRPLGFGTAFKVVDHVANVVIVEPSTAPNRDVAITRGTNEVHRLYGQGEPVVVLSLEVL